MTHSPRKALARTAARAREMHRLYPFLRTESSAARKARNRNVT